MRTPKATIAAPSADPRQRLRQKKRGDAITNSDATETAKYIGDVRRLRATATNIATRQRIASPPFKYTAIRSKTGDEE